MNEVEEFIMKKNFFSWGIIVLISIFMVGNTSAFAINSIENEDFLTEKALNDLDLLSEESFTDEFILPELDEDDVFEVEMGGDVITPLVRARTRDVIKIDAKISSKTVTISLSNIGNTIVNSYSATLNIESSSRWSPNKALPVKSTKKIFLSRLSPCFKKTYSFPYEQRYSKNRFTLNGSSKHSSGRAYLKTDNFYKNLTDANLPAWNRGTFMNKATSLDYHHYKHRYEVGSKNIWEYYSMAVFERQRPLYNKTLYYYNKTYQGGNKYTRKQSPRRYIILTNLFREGPSILSFGGR